MSQVIVEAKKIRGIICVHLRDNVMRRASAVCAMCDCGPLPRNSNRSRKLGSCMYVLRQKKTTRNLSRRARVAFNSSCASWFDRADRANHLVRTRCTITFAHLRDIETSILALRDLPRDARCKCRHVSRKCCSHEISTVILSKCMRGALDTSCTSLAVSTF